MGTDNISQNVTDRFRTAKNVVARFKAAKILPTVEGFLLHLQGGLVQYDERASKRRGHNPYALGHYMGALGKIRDDTARFKDSEDHGDLMKLKKSIERRFIVSDMPPAKRTLKAIDEFISSGKAPNYPVTKVPKNLPKEK